MKKITSFVLLLMTTALATAQTGNNGQVNEIYRPEVFRTVATIITVIIFMIFIITLLKMFFENRLKNKIVDKGVDERMAASIIQSTPSNDQHNIIKWACLLGGLGAGLFIVNYTQPLGIHSIGIMALSLSAGFLIYYFFIKLTSK